VRRHGIVRRIDISMGEELDPGAEREARRPSTSKAAVIEERLLAQLGPVSPGDPVDELIGLVDADPADGVDAVVHGRCASRTPVCGLPCTFGATVITTAPFAAGRTATLR
jgi:hypothetical protein